MTMEPPPWIPQRIVRVAARLDDLPAELVEPILRDLSLFRVLQLANTPSATPSTSHLRGKIEGSPSWRSVFRTGHDRPQRIFRSLSQLAWAWNCQNVQQVPFLNATPLDISFDELARYFGSDFGPRVVGRLESNFRWGFRQVLGVSKGHEPSLTKALLDSICLFVPLVVLKAIDTDNYSDIPDASSAQGTIPVEDTCDSFTLLKCAQNWNSAQLQAFLPYFIRAFDRLNEVKSEQLLRLAALYDEYPAWLKLPLGPQEPSPRNNVKHIGDALRTDARRIRSKMPLCRQVRKVNAMDWYRFRFSHPTLIPTDAALQFFTASKSSPYDTSLLEDARRAVEGLWFIYKHDGQLGHEKRCVRDRKTMQVRHVVYTKDRRADPSPAAEMDWLESFLRCVRWSHHQVRRNTPKLLLEPADYRQYIEAEDPETIAEQLLVDFELSRQDSTVSTAFPSLTALYMPPFSSKRTRDVVSKMWPRLVDDAVRQLYWEAAVQKFKRHLAKAPVLPEYEDGHVLACDAVSDQDDSDPATAVASSKSGKWTQTNCYICRLRINEPHKIFAAMCQPCGEFNLAGSSLSHPQNLNLEGRTALVTGARANLGFHVTLRLLRCGAAVIASTRYPRDAVARYLRQRDAADWKNRLKVVGADFRTASDAFALVVQTKSILKEWGCGLDILINNAAQTLTDSVAMEEAAVRREVILSNDPAPMLAEGSYIARVWRGATANNAPREAGLENNTQGKLPVRDTSAKDATPDTIGLEGLTLNQHAEADNDTTGKALIKPPEPSSWVQSLADIPYEDVITAHSINTFVPLILIRELLPIMDHHKRIRQMQARTGHIINVSSREGIFEASPSHRSKNGKHVHTNMSKAGLNMITETEASTAWQKYRVCMNTVDPGYMSAAPEFEKAYGGERPLSWQDGAGRVLWPIAMGEGNQEGVMGNKRMGPIWGRFLKHYGAVRIDTRFGRG